MCAIAWRVEASNSTCCWLLLVDHSSFNMMGLVCKSSKFRWKRASTWHWVNSGWDLVNSETKCVRPNQTEAVLVETLPREWCESPVLERSNFPAKPKTEPIQIRFIDPRVRISELAESQSLRQSCIYDHVTHMLWQIRPSKDYVCVTPAPFYWYIKMTINGFVNSQNRTRGSENRIWMSPIWDL